MDALWFYQTDRVDKERHPPATSSNQSVLSRDDASTIATDLDSLFRYQSMGLSRQSSESSDCSYYSEESMHTWTLPVMYQTFKAEITGDYSPLRRYGPHSNTPPQTKKKKKTIQEVDAFSSFSLDKIQSSGNTSFFDGNENVSSTPNVANRLFKSATSPRTSYSTFQNDLIHSSSSIHSKDSLAYSESPSIGGALSRSDLSSIMPQPESPTRREDDLQRLLISASRVGGAPDGRPADEYDEYDDDSLVENASIPEALTVERFSRSLVVPAGLSIEADYRQSNAFYEEQEEKRLLGKDDRHLVHENESHSITTTRTTTPEKKGKGGSLADNVSILSIKPVTLPEPLKPSQQDKSEQQENNSPAVDFDDVPFDEVDSLDDLSTMVQKVMASESRRSGATATTEGRQEMSRDTKADDESDIWQSIYSSTLSLPAAQETTVPVPIFVSAPSPQSKSQGSPKCTESDSSNRPLKLNAYASPPDVKRTTIETPSLTSTPASPESVNAHVASSIEHGTHASNDTASSDHLKKKKHYDSPSLELTSKELGAGIQALPPKKRGLFRSQSRIEMSGFLAGCSSKVKRSTTFTNGTALKSTPPKSPPSFEGTSDMAEKEESPRPPAEKSTTPRIRRDNALFSSPNKITPSADEVEVTLSVPVTPSDQSRTVKEGRPNVLAEQDITSSPVSVLDFSTNSIVPPDNNDNPLPGTNSSEGTGLGKTIRNTIRRVSCRSSSCLSMTIEPIDGTLCEGGITKKSSEDKVMMQRDSSNEDTSKPSDSLLLSNRNTSLARMPLESQTDQEKEQAPDGHIVDAESSTLHFDDALDELLEKVGLGSLALSSSSPLGEKKDGVTEFYL